MPRRKNKNKRQGYWEDRLSMRDFFCKLAAEKQFDPMIPSNWKKVTRKDIVTKVCLLISYSFLQQKTFPHPKPKTPNRGEEACSLNQD